MFQHLMGKNQRLTTTNQSDHENNKEFPSNNIHLLLLALTSLVFCGPCHLLQWNHEVLDLVPLEYSRSSSVYPGDMMENPSSQKKMAEALQLVLLQPWARL